jgi:hypothetical protein
MSAVSIGVVPIGVVRNSAVGMDVINTCLLGMAVLVAEGNVMGVPSWPHYSELKPAYIRPNAGLVVLKLFANPWIGIKGYWLVLAITDPKVK